MKTWQNCKRLYGWERVVGLTPTRKANPLSAGTGLHAGMASLVSNRDPVTAARDAVRAYKEAAGPPKYPGDETEQMETENMIRRMVLAYADYWGEESSIWTPLNQEIQFMVEVGDETGMYLRGKADNLVHYNGGLWLVDYKSIGRNDPRDAIMYELNLQPTAYLYGLTKQLSLDSMARGGKPVLLRGLIIDWLIKTKVPQFRRDPFLRTIEQLYEFEAGWVENAQQIMQAHKRVADGENWKTVFPMNGDYCVHYGRPCVFRELCLKDTPTQRLLMNKRTGDYVDEAQGALNEGIVVEERNPVVAARPKD
jgi:hypothetical protein